MKFAPCAALPKASFLALLFTLLASASPAPAGALGSMPFHVVEPGPQGRDAISPAVQKPMAAASQTASVLLPLSVGARWNYLGTFESAGGTSTCAYTLQVTGDHGAGWFGFSEGCEGDVPVEYCLSNRADGLHYSTNCDGITDVVYPYPATVGQVFGVWTVVSTTRVVTVPAGTFICHVYRLEVPGYFVGEQMLAPDVGWVATVSDDLISGEHDRFELVGRGGTTDVPGVTPNIATPALRASPNPARSNVRLSFASSAGEHTSIEIVDLQGRIVRRMPAEAQGAEWDRRRDDGERAKPGVYFARLVTAAGRSAAIAVVLAD